MSTEAESAPPKKRVLSPEHIAKMQAGRRRAKERRDADGSQESSPSEEAEPEPLLKTNSAEIRDIQEKRRLDDVIKKHIDDEDDDAAATTGTELTSEYTASDEIPAEDPNPASRDAATLGPIVPLRDDSDEELTTFADLMNEYGRAIASGNAYIYVNRKSPAVYDGVRIKGVQRSIREQITMQDFMENYGFGDYELIVYGPSQRGGFKYDPITGHAVYRKLTKPILVTVPHGYIPNLDAVSEGEEQEMLGARGQGPVSLPMARRSTNADAKIHETELTFDERARQREEEKEERRKKEEQDRLREEKQVQNSLARELTASHKQQMEQLSISHESQMNMMRDSLAKTQEELKLLRERPNRSEGEVLANSLSAILPAVTQNGSLNTEQVQQIERAAAADRERSIESHRQEIQRMQQSLQAETERATRSIDEERRRADERVTEAQRRAEDRVREFRDQSDTRVREVEQRSEKISNETRTDCDRRMADMQRNFDSRMQDVDRAHQQELRSKTDAHETRIEALRSAHQVEMGTKDAELTRVREELSQARTEAGKSLSDRINEFSETAEGLGYSKDSGDDTPKDWKAMLADTGGQVVQRLPEILDAVQNTIRARQPQAGAFAPSRQLPPPVQGREGSIAAERTMAFATEDGPQYDFSEGGDSPTPIYPNEAPSGPSRRPVPIDGSSRPQQTPGPPMPSEPAEPPPAAYKAPPPQTQAIVAQEASASPNPPTEAQPQDQQVTDSQIVEYSQLFTAAFDQGASPEEYSAAMLNQFGAPMVTEVVKGLSPERILHVLQQHQPENALLRRDGQQFLRQVWEHLNHQLGM